MTFRISDRINPESPATGPPSLALTHPPHHPQPLRARAATITVAAFLARVAGVLAA